MLDEAIMHFTEALRINPQLADVHNKLGTAFFRRGKLDKAIEHLTESLRIEPHSADSHSKLGIAFFQQGKLDKAVIHFNEALRIKPDSATVHCNLGVIFARQGKLDEAVTHFRKALEFEPDYPDATTNLGLALTKQGKLDEAVTHYIEMLRLKPDSVGSMDTLAWLLATHRDAKFYNPEEAIRLAQRACELTKYEKPQLLNTLAAAYAAAGRFSDAVTTAEKALDLAVSSGQNRLVEEIQKYLLLYKSSQPYIEKSPDQNKSAP
jgi:Flp pilus assembly protein TadD